ncbi:hypothetical protein ROZALSC1DRAFT_30789 [Rozella allomycis CSF55]|uniref:Uncharacterized protein n=1 Tax=Rozella allomycis (strain CSF55) TaxID=988480 RepID=A0A075B2L5_ROZAC|nr:hypothetical protein O9G_002123 [Rozella allomycis CSF55]RKP17395.1 hypothetical protein ROZALSC1DRAFT_30789 [Rozella allomycis CSF55]|eukprot:EPZ36840.1 hypothetical protein O9G_002123 [Rozella allomycis CSF55]
MMPQDIIDSITSQFNSFFIEGKEFPEFLFEDCLMSFPWTNFDGKRDFKGKVFHDFITHEAIWESKAVMKCDMCCNYTLPSNPWIDFVKNNCICGGNWHLINLD